MLQKFACISVLAKTKTPFVILSGVLSTAEQQHQQLSRCKFEWVGVGMGRGRRETRVACLSASSCV